MKARDYFRAAELAGAEAWLTQRFLGRTLLGTGNFGGGKQAFERSIQLSPHRWSSYLYFALFLSATKDKAAAAQTLSDMLVKDPHYEKNTTLAFGFGYEDVPHFEVLKEFRDIYRASNREQALLYLQSLTEGSQRTFSLRLESLGLSAGPWESLFALQILLDRDAPADAVHKMVKALPDLERNQGANAFMLRGKALVRLGRLDEAESDFRTALEIDPRFSAARFAYFSLLKQTAHEARAIQELHQLLAYDPVYIPAIRELLPPK